MKRDWDIMQICVVVRDLDAYLKEYWEKLGIGPWKVRSFNNDLVKDFTVDGKLVTEEFEFKVAICWVGNLEFEIVQPVKGPNVYWRFLDEKGDGLHHIKAKVKDEDMQDTINLFENNGFPVLQGGRVDRDEHYYPDTQKALGMMFELGNAIPIELDYKLYPENE